MHLIREMQLGDHAQAMALWTRTPGICVRDVDSLESTKHYLGRNPGLSFVAIDDGCVVGTIQSGHDGRRGYIQHLAVDADYRRQGIARELVECTLAALQREGITSGNLFVLKENSDAAVFWKHLGWEERHDVILYSMNLTEEENA